MGRTIYQSLLFPVPRGSDAAMDGGHGMKMNVFLMKKDYSNFHENSTLHEE